MSPKARALAAEASGTRRVLPFRAALSFLGTIAVIGVYFVSRALNPRVEPGSMLPWLVSWAILLALATWVHLLTEKEARARREARPRRLVVWLRRFHQGGDDRFPMTLLFSELSEWGALACTLSDTTIARSEDAEAMLRRLSSGEVARRHADAKAQANRRARLPFFMLIFIGVPLCGIAAQFGDRVLPTYGGWLAVTAGLILVLITARFVHKSIFRGLPSNKAIEAEAKQAADQALAQATVVSADRASMYFHHLSADLAAQKNALEQGFLVLRVDDADWQAVVGAALDAANAVLIDISHLSENVEWELRQLSQRQGKIVFALGVASSTDVEHSWNTHPSCQRLEALLGAGWHERNQVFFYPERVEPSERLSEASRLMPTFTAKIYEAMVG